MVNPHKMDKAVDKLAGTVFARKFFKKHPFEAELYQTKVDLFENYHQYQVDPWSAVTGDAKKGKVWQKARYPYSYPMAYKRKSRSRSRSRYSSGGGRRSRIGEKIGTSTCKTAFLNNPATIDNYDSREQYTEPLIAIAPGQDLDQRQRQVVNFRGWKIDFEMTNNLNFPLYVNVAVLAPKAGAVNVSRADFFRYQGNDRAVNFDNVLTAIEFAKLPINVDRYTVLKHKRMTFTPGLNELSTLTRDGNNWRKFRWYIKLKRQIRFDASQNQPESGQCFLVFWCDAFGAASGDQPTSNALSYRARIVQYFRDPAN